MIVEIPFRIGRGVQEDPIYVEQRAYIKIAALRERNAREFCTKVQCYPRLPQAHCDIH